MATPDTNLSSSRGSADVNGNHTTHPPSVRHLHNFNTFQFVSQLVSATPPYMFNMSTPFPGNFFSDLLRRMAPRAGTPGLPPDSNLQQQIRAALLAKGTPPPTLPQSVMPPPLDLAALAAQHRHQTLPPTSSHDKGVKRSLFSDISALSSCEEENSAKRPRIEEPREDRREHPPEGLTAPFLMQPPFIPSSVHPPPDVISPWSARASLMRHQMPIPTHVPPAPLDPYRLLLDLRLAGQLRSIAASQALHHKESSLGHPALIPPITNLNRTTPPRETRIQKEEHSIPVPSHQPTTLRGDDSRLSAFHPPGRNNDAPPETSDEEGCDRRSNSRNSSNSSTSSSHKDGLGPQYIFKHLTEIYRTIDNQRSNDRESVNEEQRNGYSPPSVRPSVDVTHHQAPEITESSNKHSLDIDKSAENHSRSSVYQEEVSRSRECYSHSNGHIDRPSLSTDGPKIESDSDNSSRNHE
ncbi:UNVERIFIED_CONTAM: hypothetical protein RMT77_010217 [Armadillidium vulgare]